MTNPDLMQNMMKQQLTGLVPQVNKFVPVDSKCVLQQMSCSEVLEGFWLYTRFAADCNGSFCKLLLLRIHHGQNSLSSIAFVPSHASGLRL